MQWTETLNGAKFSLEDKDLASVHTKIEKVLQGCYELGQHVVLSSDFLGLVSDKEYEHVFEPLFKNFELKVIVGYRRFYSWAPSVLFELSLMRSSGTFNPSSLSSSLSSASTRLNIICSSVNNKYYLTQIFVTLY